MLTVMVDETTGAALAFAERHHRQWLSTSQDGRL